jgi:biopolymer transport protein TolR
MSVQFTAGSGQGRSARARRRRPPMSEINVTPLVDVMLVLLIVFMIAAPLLTVGVEVDLPESDVPEVAGNDEPLAVTIDAEGRIFLQDTEITIEELGPRLVAISQNNSDVRVFVRGDETIDYGSVMTVMGALNQAGFNNVALIARLPGTVAQ